MGSVRLPAGIHQGLKRCTMVRQGEEGLLLVVGAVVQDGDKVLMARRPEGKVQRVYSRILCPPARMPFPPFSLVSAIPDAA